MKKRILYVVFLLMLVFCLSGCGSQKSSTREKDGTIRIVAAIFPAYDWTKNILGDDHAGTELTLLLDNGVDLHSYQPSVDDILTISNADLFIYVGGESDQWVTDALAQTANPDIRVIKMLDVIGDAAREEELTEGMQTGEEADPDAGPEYDEHVWLSLRNAEVICSAIAAELSALDPAHTKTYDANAAAYQAKLRELDGAYEQAAADGKKKTLLFGDRFPFRYLTEDYGLDYYAAFSGCSAETEASFETIMFLARKADELDLPAVLTIDGSDRRVAETIVRNTSGKDRELLTLDSLQSVSAKDIEKGTTYLSVMENNLGILQKALETEVK